MISLLLPSRGRPQNIDRLFTSILETADDIDDIEVVMELDTDDTSEYKPVLDKFMHKIRVSVLKTDRQVLSKYWNDCYKYSIGNILMHLGDDIIFRTQGWDTKVKETFAEYPDQIVFVYGDDGSGVHDGNFGTHGFISRKWAEAVGYFVPPYFSSDYNDTWLNDVAKVIGRHRHIDILTEHMHPDLGKAEYDKNHLERIERHKRDNVSAVYESKHQERLEDAKKLRKVMQ